MLARGGVALSGMKKWTDEEEATIRRLYPSDIAATYAALPDRTRHAIQRKAQAMRVHNRENTRMRWTAAEDTRLRRLWDAGLSVQRIALRMERAHAGVFKRAERLGLPLGVPQGYEYLTEASRRVGVHTSTLWMMLKWAGVVTTAVRSKSGPQASHRYYVDPFDVDEAVAKWLATETITAAARVREIPLTSMRKMLLVAGVFTPRAADEPRAAHRIPTETIDRVVAEWRGNRRAV